ncbi:MAG: alanine racemase [Planctomycetes bacterium]|nr:alanine racemase [Planctomycetota bacterium]
MLQPYRTPSDARKRRAWIEVDLDAVNSNVRNLRELLSPQTELMAVVKADAYGHGAVAISHEALSAGASWLGVATVPEAIEIRDAGVDAPILIFGAVRDKQEIRELSRYALCATVCDVEHARQLSESIEMGERPRVDVHLNIDTGMSRLGTPTCDARTLWQHIKCDPNLSTTGIYSHFACAEERDSQVMRLQHQQFANVLARLERDGMGRVLTHLANTAGTIRDPATHFDMVRVGLGIYGLTPFCSLEVQTSLKPALRVRARVSQVKEVPAGTSISYGGQFTAPSTMRIAVVSIGYADGVPRALSGQIDVLTHGQRARQIGAITMDQLMIDVTDMSSVRPLDVVTLLGTDGGETITVDDWADRMPTVTWEILCGFKYRLPRVLTRGSHSASFERAIGRPINLGAGDLSHAPQSR